MRPTAQCVSVDYAPLLARSLPIWKETCERVLVVTAERDEATRRLCETVGVETLITDVFWQHGAKFNKGAAIAAGFDFLAPKGWHLFFDADIVPPAGWSDSIDRYRPAPGALYGVDRYMEDGSLIREAELAGCFHLAHADDPAMQIRPVVDTHWSHAGNYDSTFQARWPRERRIRLPMRVTHLGNPFRNWCGVGNDAEMNRLFRDRRRLGTWQHETIEDCSRQDSNLHPPG